jgi:SAM-dependent methyltransferase
MNHVQYHEWSMLIRRIVSRYALTTTPSLLEIGSGTGVLGSLLAGEGYRIQCSDRSFGMCQIAQQRCAPVVVADGCALPFKNRYDMVIFLYDGINYLLTPQEYSRLFASVAQCLVPGGLFLFDITTHANSMRYFTDLYDYENLDDCFYARHSYYNAEARLQYNDFTIFVPHPQHPTLFEKHDEHHIQRVFPVTQIQQCIPDDHFETIGIWDSFSFKRFSASSERIHFLLRKKRVP